MSGIIITNRTSSIRRKILFIYFVYVFYSVLAFFLYVWCAIMLYFITQYTYIPEHSFRRSKLLHYANLALTLEITARNTRRKSLKLSEDFSFQSFDILVFYKNTGLVLQVLISVDYAYNQANRLPVCHSFI